MTNESASSPVDSTLVDRLLGHLWRWFAVMVATGWLIGVSVFPLLQSDLAEYLMENNLEPEDRRDVLEYGALGVIAVACLYLVAWLLHRRRDPSIRPTEAFAAFSRVWFVTLGTPLVVGLLVGGMAEGARILSLLFIATITGLTMAMVHLRPLQIADAAGVGENGADVTPSGSAPDDDASPEQTLPEATPAPPAADPPAFPVWYRDRAFGVTAILCVLYGLAMTHLSLTEHWSIATHAYDLGIYDNVMWNTTQGDWLGCSICKGGNHSSGHYDPILILLSPIYAVWPRAEMLLVFQAWWLAMSGLPLYLIGRRALPESRWFSVVIVGVFFMHPALHGINLFDFHSLALCVPLVLWAVHCIDAGAKWWFPPVLLLLLLVREDMPLVALFIGAYAVLRGRTLWGALTSAAAVAYLVTIKLYFMPDPDLLMQSSRDASSHIYYYSDMIPYPDEGMRGLIVSTFGNPAFTAKVIFLNAAKNFYLFGLLMPLLFLPLLGGSKRVLMLYGLAFIGLVTRKHVYSFHFQYSAVLLPFLVASVPDAAQRVCRWAVDRRVVPSAAHLRRTLLWGIVTATLLLSASYGAFIPNRTFKGGWNRLNRIMSDEEKDHYARVREMVEAIPDDAVVSATSSLVPHVSNRAEVYKYPSLHGAEYLLLNVAGLNKKKKYKKRLKSLRRKYETVLEDGGVELLRLIERTPAEPGSKKKDAKKPKKPKKPRKPASKDADDGDDEDKEDERDRQKRLKRARDDDSDENDVNPNEF